MLAITRYGNGQCVWCLTHGEGVEAAFNDGLKGFLCRKHLWEAMKSRSQKSLLPDQRKEPAHAEPASRKGQ